MQRKQMPECVASFAVSYKTRRRSLDKAQQRIPTAD